MNTDEKKYADLSFLTQKNMWNLPVVMDNVLAREGEYISKAEFNKQNAREIADAFRLNQEVADYYCQLFPDADDLSTASQEGPLKEFVEQAIRLQPILPYMKQAKTFGTLTPISAYVRDVSRPGKKSWLPKVYLKGALKHWLIFLGIAVAVYYFLSSSFKDHNLWAASILILLGLGGIGIIVERFVVRLRFARFLSKEGLA